MSEIGFRDEAAKEMAIFQRSGKTTVSLSSFVF